MKIDEKLLETNDSICREIDIAIKDNTQVSDSAKEIIKNLRDLVEAVAFKEYCDYKGIDVYPTKEFGEYHYTSAIAYCNSHHETRYIKKFHDYLQISSSHTSVNKKVSRVLLEKYISFLIKIKELEKNKYNLDILENIYQFPIDCDPKLKEYYSKILIALDDKSGIRNLSVKKSGRCYITRKRLLIVNNKKMYELTLSPVNENTSKFDRITAYSLEDIPDYYATLFDIVLRSVKFDNKYFDIFVVTNYIVSIRPCELNNIGRILFGENNVLVKTSQTEYKNLMKYLTNNKCSLLDIVNQNDFNSVINHIKGEAQNNQISNCLIKSKEIIDSNIKGCNTLKYILYILQKSIVSKQIDKYPNNKMSGLYLSYGTIPFEEMPFCTGLLGHNPRIYDLIDIFEVDEKQHELLKRLINNNTENNNLLFTKINEIEDYSAEEITHLIQKHNDAVQYYKHKPRRHLETYANHVYINEHDYDTSRIIKHLQNKAEFGEEGYSEFAEMWIKENPESKIIDDETKRKHILNLFSKSKVALIYGSAGTGKTTFISYVSKMYSELDILYLANTNPAVSNMERIVKNNNGTYLTIEKAKKGNRKNKCDLLIIDECSTISNKDMLDVLSNIDSDLLLLAGDTYQIESIKFGNWFSLAKSFLSKHSIFELSETKRTDEKRLSDFWECARHKPDSIIEYMSVYNLFYELNDSLLVKEYEDEIVLCLNYDGLYGINNINKMMQKANNNKEYVWKLNTYKIGDPILFYETNKYNSIIYNNLKGKIVNIERFTDSIIFQIEIDKTITERMAISAGLKYIGSSENKKTILEFTVKETKMYDDGDEDDSYDTIVPFQIAYAVSIHKSQGLEYDSVKIVITSDNEENITKNIFYTAITRAKKELKIYSLQKTLANIVSSFAEETSNEDVYLLSNKHKLKINNKENVI